MASEGATNPGGSIRQCSILVQVMTRLPVPGFPFVIFRTSSHAKSEKVPASSTSTDFCACIVATNYILFPTSRPRRAWRRRSVIGGSFTVVGMITHSRPLSHQCTQKRPVQMVIPSSFFGTRFNALKRKTSDGNSIQVVGS